MQGAEPGDVPRPRTTLRRWLAAVVVLGSLGWVLWLLQGTWSEAVGSLAETRVPGLLLGWGLGLLATFMGFLGFVELLASTSGKRAPIRRMGHLYFAAQLMRHLPGRFWGIAYQIGSTRGEVSATGWIAANAAHMVLMMSLAVAFAMAVVLLDQEPWLSVAWVLAVGVLGRLAFSRALLASARSTISRRLPDVARRIDTLASAFAAISSSSWRRVLLWLAMSWIVYFAAWGLYAGAHPAADFADGLRLCALYTLAWLAGYLSFVTPSGLGVRELVFAAIASGFPPSVVAFGMIVGRLSLLLVDVAFGLIFLRPGTDEQR